MTTKIRGQCEVCIHRYQNLAGSKCEAYPEGIPDDLFFDRIPHTVAYKGDNGVRFKQDVTQPILEE